MFRAIGAILAGLVTFVALEYIASQVAKGIWPAYALAAPSRAYALNMLLARQGAGMLITLAAGAAAAWVGRGERRAALWFGLALLVGGVVNHIQIWDKYPVWYHLLFFAWIVPLAVLGGRLARRNPK
jgi:hypothetical protein